MSFRSDSSFKSEPIQCSECSKQLDFNYELRRFMLRLSQEVHPYAVSRVIIETSRNGTLVCFKCRTKLDR